MLNSLFIESAILK